eukprot:g17761.t1
MKANVAATPKPSGDGEDERGGDTGAGIRNLVRPTAVRETAAEDVVASSRSAGGGDCHVYLKINSPLSDVNGTDWGLWGSESPLREYHALAEAERRKLPHGRFSDLFDLHRLEQGLDISLHEYDDDIVINNTTVVCDHYTETDLVLHADSAGFDKRSVLLEGNLAKKRSEASRALAQCAGTLSVGRGTASSSAGVVAAAVPTSISTSTGGADTTVRCDGSELEQPSVNGTSTTGGPSATITRAGQIIIDAGDSDRHSRCADVASSTKGRGRWALSQDDGVPDEKVGTPPPAATEATTTSGRSATETFCADPSTADAVHNPEGFCDLLSPAEEMALHGKASMWSLRFLQTTAQKDIRDRQALFDDLRKHVHNAKLAFFAFRGDVLHRHIKRKMALPVDDGLSSVTTEGLFSEGKRLRPCSTTAQAGSERPPVKAKIAGEVETPDPASPDPASSAPGGSRKRRLQNHSASLSARTESIFDLGILRVYLRNFLPWADVARKTMSLMSSRALWWQSALEIVRDMNSYAARNTQPSFVERRESIRTRYTDNSLTYREEWERHQHGYSVSKWEAVTKTTSQFARSLVRSGLEIEMVTEHVASESDSSAEVGAPATLPKKVELVRREKNSDGDATASSSPERLQQVQLSSWRSIYPDVVVDSASKCAYWFLRRTLESNVEAFDEVHAVIHNPAYRGRYRQGDHYVSLKHQDLDLLFKAALDVSVMLYNKPVRRKWRRYPDHLHWITSTFVSFTSCLLGVNGNGNAYLNQECKQIVSLAAVAKEVAELARKEGITCVNINMNMFVDSGHNRLVGYTEQQLLELEEFLEMSALFYDETLLQDFDREMAREWAARKVRHSFINRYNLTEEERKKRTDAENVLDFRQYIGGFQYVFRGREKEFLREMIGGEAGRVEPRNQVETESASGDDHYTADSGARRERQETEDEDPNVHEELALEFREKAAGEAFVGEYGEGGAPIDHILFTRRAFLYGRLNYFLQEWPDLALRHEQLELQKSAVDFGEKQQRRLELEQMQMRRKRRKRTAAGPSASRADEQIPVEEDDDSPPPGEAQMAAAIQAFNENTRRTQEAECRRRNIPIEDQSAKHAAQQEVHQLNTEPTYYHGEHCEIEYPADRILNAQAADLSPILTPPPFGRLREKSLVKFHILRKPYANQYHHHARQARDPPKAGAPKFSQTAINFSLMHLASLSPLLITEVGTYWTDALIMQRLSRCGFHLNGYKKLKNFQAASAIFGNNSKEQAFAESARIQESCRSVAILEANRTAVMKPVFRCGKIATDEDFERCRFRRRFGFGGSAASGDSGTAGKRPPGQQQAAAPNVIRVETGGGPRHTLIYRIIRDTAIIGLVLFAVIKLVNAYSEAKQYLKRERRRRERLRKAFLKRNRVGNAADNPIDVNFFERQKTVLAATWLPDVVLDAAAGGGKGGRATAAALTPMFSSTTMLPEQIAGDNSSSSSSALSSSSTSISESKAAGARAEAKSASLAAQLRQLLAVFRDSKNPSMGAVDLVLHVDGRTAPTAATLRCRQGDFDVCMNCAKKMARTGYHCVYASLAGTTVDQVAATAIPDKKAGPPGLAATSEEVASEGEETAAASTAVAAAGVSDAGEVPGGAELQKAPKIPPDTSKERERKNNDEGNKGNHANESASPEPPGSESEIAESLRKRMAALRERINALLSFLSGAASDSHNSILNSFFLLDGDFEFFDDAGGSGFDNLTDEDFIGGGSTQDHGGTTSSSSSTAGSQSDFPSRYSNPDDDEESESSSGLGRLFEEQRSLSQPKAFKVQRHVKTRFSDVIGQDIAVEKMREFVDILQYPDRYAQVGSKVPKGGLLLGPPGCGKTLLASAVAGECNLPFISAQASEFVQVYVGMGAKNVQQLFALARKEAEVAGGCIVFIDEIDSIGRDRAKSFTNGDGETGNTLNQLLTEMDGFHSKGENIVVLAATNRASTLD